MTKKLVAYQVDRDDYEGSVVVFDSHGLAARRRGACILDIGSDDEYCRVHRVKEFDQYAEKGYVPYKALLEHGWWMYSAHDNKELREAWEGYNGEEENDDYYTYIYDPLKLVFFQNEQGVWLDWDEMERHAYYINEAKDRLDWWIETVMRCYPQLTFTKFEGGPGRITHTAEYTFPGAKYGGHVRWDWKEGVTPDPKQDFSCWVANGDKEAFDNYMKTVV